MAQTEKNLTAEFRKPEDMALPPRTLEKFLTAPDGRWRKTSELRRTLSPSAKTATQLEGLWTAELKLVSDTNSSHPVNYYTHAATKLFQKICFNNQGEHLLRPKHGFR